MDHAKILVPGNDNPALTRLFADALACFRAFGIRVVGTLGDSSLIVQSDQHPRGDMWSIGDNCGELHMTRINSGEPGVDVSYEAHGLMLDGATVAYRVRCRMDGTPIDWSGRLVDCLDALRA